MYRKREGGKEGRRGGEQWRRGGGGGAGEREKKKKGELRERERERARARACVFVCERERARARASWISPFLWNLCISLQFVYRIHPALLHKGHMWDLGSPYAGFVSCTPST